MGFPRYVKVSSNDAHAFRRARSGERGALARIAGHDGRHVYPIVRDASARPKGMTFEDWAEEIERDKQRRALADKATAVRGTARQLVKTYFERGELRHAAVYGSRRQRRAALRAEGLISRGYQAVP